MARSSSTRRGNGAGWGGPAKGADPHRKPKQDFDANTNAQGHNVTTPPALNRKAMREDQAEQVKDMLFGLALGAESESAKVQACTAFLNRVEGMPKVTVENVVKPVEQMSREELDAEIAAEKERLKGSGIVASAGSP